MVRLSDDQADIWLDEELPKWTNEVDENNVEILYLAAFSFNSASHST